MGADVLSPLTMTIRYGGLLMAVPEAGSMQAHDFCRSLIFPLMIVQKNIEMRLKKNRSRFDLEENSMKRLPFFFTILTLLLLPLVVSHVQFVIGAKIGSNFSWIGGQDFLDDLNSWDEQERGETSAKIGFTGGLYLSVEVSKYLSLQQK